MKTKQMIATGIVGVTAIAGIGLSASAGAGGNHGCHHKCTTTTQRPTTTTEKPTTTTEKPTTTTTEVTTTTPETTTTVPETSTTMPEVTTTVPTSLIPPVSVDNPELYDHEDPDAPYYYGDDAPLKISG